MIATVGQLSLREGTFQVRSGEHLPVFAPGAKAVASVEIVNSDGTRAACGFSIEECEAVADALSRVVSQARNQQWLRARGGNLP